MAKPDKDDGFYQIAYELMAALASAGFNKGAWIVLHEIIAQIYGPAKLPSASVSPSALARSSGLDKSNLIRSIRDLVTAGVLVKLGTNDFRFVKDYESWNLPGESSSVKQARVSFTRQALLSTLAYRKTNKQLSGVTLTPAGVRVTPAGVTLTPERCHPDTGAVYRNARPKREKEEEEREIQHPPTPLKGEMRDATSSAPPLNSNGHAPDPIPPYPDPEGPLEIMPGAHTLTADESRSLWRSLWRTFGDLPLSNAWYEHQCWYPSERWRHAIRVAARKGIKPQSIRYLERIAGSPDLPDREQAPPASLPRRTTPIPPYVPPSGPAKLIRPAERKPTPKRGGDD